MKKNLLNSIGKLLVFSYFILISFPVFSTEVCEVDTFITSKYNSLLSVEEANSLLKKNKNFPSFIEEAGKLASEYKFDSFFGLRLLHKHTYLEDNLKMVEYTQNNNIFITKPFNFEDLRGETIVPASWIPVENGYTVFEYSSDKEIESYYIEIKNNPGFLCKFHNLLNEYGIQNLIAPALIGKSKQIETDSTIGLVEETFDNPFQSVISLKDISEDGSKLIQTLWTLLSPKEVRYVGLCRRGVMCQFNGIYHASYPYHYNGGHINTGSISK